MNDFGNKREENIICDVINSMHILNFDIIFIVKTRFYE